jgi:hypothetical protein
MSRRPSKEEDRENGSLVYWRFLYGPSKEEMVLLELAGTTNSLVTMNNAKYAAHFLFVILGHTPPKAT